MSDHRPPFFESMQRDFLTIAHALIVIDQALLTSSPNYAARVRVEWDRSTHRTIHDSEMTINLLGFLSLRSNQNCDDETRNAFERAMNERSNTSLMRSIQHAKIGFVRTSSTPCSES